MMRLVRDWRIGWGLVLSIVVSAGVVSAEDVSLEPPAVRALLARALPLLQKSAATYIAKRDCFSCHHQALPAIAVATLKRAGHSVDTESAADQSDFTEAYFGGRGKRVRVGEGGPGGAYNAGYALWSLHAEGRKPNGVTNDLVAYLRTKHRRDGSWRIRTHRPPLEDSHFTATALSLKGLQLYAGQSGAKDLAERTGRTRAWLIRAKPKTNEDRVFRLLGVAWAGGADKKVKEYARDLGTRQRDDGGWSQLDDGSSDAYATGQALYALRQSGLAISDDRFQQGCRYLVKTAKPDGSWHVVTRSKAIQKYFETDFPHEKSQFISICGTCWAVLSLAELLPSTPN